MERKKVFLSLFFPALNLIIFGILSVLLLSENDTVSPAISAAIISCICGSIIPAFIILKFKINTSEYFVKYLKVFGLYLLSAVLFLFFAFISLMLYLIILTVLMICTAIIFWLFSDERIKRTVFVMTDTALYISAVIFAGIAEFAANGLKF